MNTHAENYLRLTFEGVAMRTLVTAEQSICEKLDEMDIDKAIAYLQKIKEENKGKNLIFVLDCTSDIYGTTELNLYSE